MIGSKRVSTDQSNEAHSITHGTKSNTRNISQPLLKCPRKFDAILTPRFLPADLSLAELQRHSECAIPHIVSSIGTIVTASCAGVTKVLRLTSGHLVSERVLEGGRRGVGGGNPLKSVFFSFFPVLTESFCKVYTQRGLQAAGELTKDDVLFSDLAEQHQCQIVELEKEQTVQRYFGLNCYESQVCAV